MLIGFYSFRTGISDISVLYMVGNFMAERLSDFQELLSSMELLVSLVYKNSNSECQAAFTQFSPAL
jgi:hypothetical protein